MKDKILGIMLFVFLILAYVTMGYGVGANIVADYYKHGIGSVIMSFVIGIPLVTIFMILMAYIGKKFKLK